MLKVEILSDLISLLEGVGCTSKVEHLEVYRFQG